MDLAFSGSYVNCSNGLFWHQFPMFGKETKPQFSTSALGLFSLMIASITACRSIAYIMASRTFGSVRGSCSCWNHNASK